MFAPVLAVVSSIAIGAADFVGGRAAVRSPATGVVAVAQLVDLVLLSGLAAIGGADPRSSDLLLGAVAGVAGSLAFAVFLMALARGPMSLVSPFTALIGVATPVIVGVALGERPSFVAWIGVVLGIAAIGLTSRSPRSSVAQTARGTTLAMAGAAGVGFAAFVIALDATRSAAGLTPLISARVAGVPVLVALVIARKQAWPSGGVLRAALGVGVLETIAVATLIAALHAGSLVSVSVLSSLYPVATVLLAVTLLHERLDRVHRAGVALAIVALGLIAAG